MVRISIEMKLNWNFNSDKNVYESEGIHHGNVQTGVLFLKMFMKRNETKNQNINI